MLVARREDELRRLAAELDGDAEVEVCDVADRAAVQAATARILERHPEVDLLVNSAGILVRGTFVDAPLDEIERALVVNYLGCVWVTRGLLDGIRAAAATRGRARHRHDRVDRRCDRVHPGRTVLGVEVRPGRILAVTAGLAARHGCRGAHDHAGVRDDTGFPHPKIFATPLGRPFVVGPERVATKVLAAVERGKAEVIVPWFPYGLGAIAQAVLPKTTARVLTHFDYPDDA